MTKTFTQTSNEPYVRHNYQLVYSDGRKVIFDNYEDARTTWFQTPKQFLSHIEVLDKKQKSKGFK